MKNLRRLALVAGIALSAVAFSPKAQAQTADIDFNGTVPSNCTINFGTGGTLAASPTVPERAILSEDIAGVPGNINVTCGGGVVFTVASVTDTGTSLTSGSYATNVDGVFAKVVDTATNTNVAYGEVSPSGRAALLNNPPGVPGPLQAGPIVNKNYGVWLSLFNIAGRTLSPGNYSVRVSVSLAPQ
ncbi:hypothetical protein [Anabaena sp. UHCC 0204]|uniref:hypothetical protein n=1 Tax=Anabaena sp. UHCC 0204 TaxID=2590009 RepID=UPI0014486EBF|nr:hypothetical protein [Anabaena sp. UHCC 0204]MTJ10168.1 hypothetical protein [Anabaena sp. UHCC 0204]